MILLTELSLVNKDCHTQVPQGEEIIALDAFAVLVVKKFKYNDKTQEGSMVILTDDRTFYVSELMTDVVHMVEAEVKRNDEDD